MTLHQFHPRGSGYDPDLLTVIARSPVLRMCEVHHRVSLSVSHVYALIAAGVFPPLISVGARARGMPEVLLDSWLCTCIALRDAMASLSDPVVFAPWTPESVVVPDSRGIQLLTLVEVEARVAKKRTAIYRAIAEDTFPAPVPVTVAARRWVADEIDAWLRDRILVSLRDAKDRVLVSFPPPPSRSARSRRGRSDPRPRLAAPRR